MWPPTLYEAPMSKVEKLERLISSYIRTPQLGLPRCLSNIVLYGNCVLELPILSEENKCTKLRLDMMVTDLSDTFVI